MLIQDTVSPVPPVYFFLDYPIVFDLKHVFFGVL
jgi:hypothetical protein